MWGKDGWYIPVSTDCVENLVHFVLVKIKVNLSAGLISAKFMLYKCNMVHVTLLAIIGTQ